MRITMRHVLLAILLFCATARAADTLTVHVNKPTTQVSPSLYGIFFEEIGRAGDGGLYAEMIQNCSFQDSADTPLAWTMLTDTTGEAEGAASIDRSKPINDQNTNSLLLTVSKANPRFGIYNEGFKGMSLKKDAKYRFSLRARRDSTFNGLLTATLETPEGKP